MFKFLKKTTAKSKYSNLAELQQALVGLGFEYMNVIFGVDFTGSNNMTGAKSFNGKCLHELSASIQNPYQFAIENIGQAIKFDQDNKYEMYGFGDSETSSHSVFSFSETSFNSASDCVNGYNNILNKGLSMSGPTSFAPIIRKTIEQVREKWEFTLLIIIADGAITDNLIEENVAAIVEASNYPIAITCVGVGDGPFNLMEAFDDKIKGAKFDNFQFVNSELLKSKYKKNQEKFKQFYALEILMELPKMFEEMKKNNILTKPQNLPPFNNPPKTLTHFH